MEMVLEYELLPKCISSKGIISESYTMAWNKNDIFEEIVHQDIKIYYNLVFSDEQKYNKLLEMI
jgi:hypothetical protein